MDNNKYKSVAVEAGTYAAIGFILQAAERLIWYAAQPDVLVEEKKYLKENFEILRMNFTK